MDAASFVAIFLPMMAGATDEPRRFPRTFTSVSIITGSEIVLKVPPRTGRDRRIAAYRKSPDARPLNLVD
jgi:hypothetical protein